MALYQYGILILFGLAISDLMVGVSNDAVNFLNSSVGSRVAPRKVILLVASLGIMAGVLFSSGMMEVARKGIFHPQLFTMPELMVVFLAVMLTDVILLDLYNTFGLPTSTTVSIVFELLGAAVAMSLIKLSHEGLPWGGVVNYINTGKAFAIIFGILLSVVVAFFVGALVQYVTRILFTFNYERRLKRYGAIWGGVALATITYFILIKGAKGATFITPETLAWIKGHTWRILLGATAVSAVILQMVMMFTRVNILRIIVLAGTFALAMAFAANDLVNFIGVPLAGLSAYTVAAGSENLLEQTMDALAQPVRSETAFLLVAGAIMVSTLWLSRKAKTVSKTELSLGRQDEGFERFGSTLLSQTIVRIVASGLSRVGRVFPTAVRQTVKRRTDRSHYNPKVSADGVAPAFDQMRAGVNLMVASALIAWATSMKLPLSTTYVTFMVSMGSSLSDQAWGRDSAVYRVTGVLTVIGGWFFTAMMAFSVSSIFALAIYFGGAPAVVGILALAIVFVVRTHFVHGKRREADEAADVFNLRKISDARAAVSVTFEHAGIFLREVSKLLNNSFDGLMEADRQKLKATRQKQKRIQDWSNIIVANIFKVLRLLNRRDVADTQRYAKTISTLQEISESTRDIVLRADLHVSNHHAPLLRPQVEELTRIKSGVVGILERASHILLAKDRPESGEIRTAVQALRDLTHQYDQNQIKRIQDNTSKTRLSILFYAFMWDGLKIAEQADALLSIFQDPVRPMNGARGPGADDVSEPTERSPVEV